MFWLAYHQDWSGFAVFAEEIDAHRYANGKMMAVVEVPFGYDLGPGCVLPTESK